MFFFLLYFPLKDAPQRPKIFRKDMCIWRWKKTPVEEKTERCYRFAFLSPLFFIIMHRSLLFSFCPTKDSLVVCLYYLRQERIEEFLFRSKFPRCTTWLVVHRFDSSFVYLDLHRFLIYFFVCIKKLLRRKIHKYVCLSIQTVLLANANAMNEERKT